MLIKKAMLRHDLTGIVHWKGVRGTLSTVDSSCDPV
jgi:hypothetical protein